MEKLKFPFKRQLKKFHKKYRQQLDEAYINQSFIVENDQTFIGMDAQSGEQYNCEIRIQKKKTVVNITQTHIELYTVPKALNEISEKCKFFASLRTVIERYKLSDIFKEDITDPRNHPHLKVSRGTSNGKTYYVFRGQMNDQGMDIEFSGLFNPQASQLYATEYMEYTVKAQGKVFTKEITKNRKIDDIDASSINTNGIPRVNVRDPNLLSFNK